MSLKNYIINKDDMIDLKFELKDKVLKKIETFDELSENIQSFDQLINYDKISKLDLYSYIINNDILLYKPTEYNGWLSLIDYFSNHTYEKHKINILLDCDIYGTIELIKYIRELDDNFYITSDIADIIVDDKFMYLKNYFNLKTIQFKLDELNDKYLEYFDIIITSDISKVIMYKQYIDLTGEILLIQPISFITEDNIVNLNNIVVKFDQIEMISPIILKPSGDFVTIFRNIARTTDVDFHSQSQYGSMMFEMNNFFKYHTGRVNKILKIKRHILKIQNKTIQDKLISKYENKLLSLIINIMLDYNIPIKTSVTKYYDNKFLIIVNKLYASLNFLSYQFINYSLNSDADEQISINLIKSSSDEHKYSRLENIAKNLFKIKRAIDTRYIKKWNFITYDIDNYKSLGDHITKKYTPFENRDIKASNAFLKIYEILFNMNLFDDKLEQLKSFHFCEAPGMFIIGMNHYIKTKTNIKKWEWYGNSLSDDFEKTALGDKVGLIKKYKDKWLIGPKKNGDIRNLDNITYFKSVLGEVDFITSDCGICIDDSKLNLQENLTAETDFAQFYNMVNLLKVGGSGIIKMFIPLRLPSNVCLIYTLTKLFKDVYIIKPITSRPNNSEVYIVGKKFRGIDKELLDDLRKLLEGGNFDPYLNWLDYIPSSFMEQLEDYIVDITRQQISYLLNIFHFYDNNGEYSKIKGNMKKIKDITNQTWCDNHQIVSNKSYII